MTTRHMERALALAWSAAGGVSPRPPVGAVVVDKDGSVVGEGATEPRPGRHAEVVALEVAGARARGSTLFCTLEPHSFKGVAPPCTQAIIDAGITRVVAALADPNPTVNGEGFRQLREAGVEVDLSTEESVRQRAVELVESFAKFIRTGRPFVIAKFAMSLDGKIATRSGDSQWITTPAARQHAHRLRHRADAIVTGIGTVLADDPRLNERDEQGEPTGRPRLRVVVDSEGRLPPSARMFDEPGDILWALGECATASLSHPGLTEVRLPVGPEGLDLRLLLAELASLDCSNVLVEAGGHLLGSFFDLGLIDRVDAYIAPIVIGGTRAPSPVAGAGAESIAESFRLQRVRYTQVDGDMLVTGYVSR